MPRQLIWLNDIEKAKLERLKRTHLTSAAPVWAFWGTVCAKRGLDMTTLIALEERIPHALPVGHGAHWCSPMPLVVDKKAQEQAA